MTLHGTQISCGWMWRSSRNEALRKSRAISPRLGAFSGPLIGAITVIIDLLHGLITRCPA